MENSPTFESSSSSVTQEILHISVWTKGSMLYSQETDTGSYPEPDETDLNLQILYLWS